MMTYKDDYHTLSRTLCNTSPHKSVLIKNAFQCQQELSKLGLGSPKPLATDMTLFSPGSSLRARIMDLQPLNDPFLVDNIFKSPKKRRRGLLSWGAMSIHEPSAHAEKHPLWDFQRHVKARNRRRSILGSKYSLSSMKRQRRPRSKHNGNGGEHTRSVSDPTSAISPMSQPAKIASPVRAAKPFIASTPKICEPPEPAAFPRLLEFPQLADDGSMRSSFASDYRMSDSFTVLPMNPKATSTLRGVPGHPRTAEHGRLAPPYISVSALRLINNAGDWEDPEQSPVAEPKPVLLRCSGKAQQRCSSLPHCSPPSQADFRTESRVPAHVVFDPARRDLPRCPAATGPYKVVSPLPASRFRGVKNSLDIRQPAAASASASARTQSPPYCVAMASHTSLNTASSCGWQLPTALRVLRRIAICGGSEKH
ncbi:hypothetical protein GGF46_000656 [Coemansia sp. RSA 552]|nr:hypothetical protein GGF46_000656 [Coemansia sp. RSA 552]